MAITPNMNLDLPTVSVTIGPEYATKNNQALTDIDAHDHTDGKGLLIPSAGMNINSDLEFNGNSATELKSSVFSSQLLALTGTNFLQVINGELFFNDGAANNVPITSGGSLDITSSGGIGGDYTSAGASLAFTNSTNTYRFVNGSAVESALRFKGLENSGKNEWNTLAISSSPTLTDTDDNFILLVDTSSSRTITLPDPTLGKRTFIIKDATGQSESNNITLARNGAETIDGIAASRTLAKNFGVWMIVSDLTNWFMVKDDRPSVTVFHGPTSVGSDTIPIAFASPTLTAAAFTVGDPVTRAGNVLSFPFVGKFKVSMDMPELVSGAAVRRQVMFRLRNTTDGITVATSTLAKALQSGLSAEQTAHMDAYANITDISKSFELQWASGVGTSTVANATVDGETPPRWKIFIEKDY